MLFKRVLRARVTPLLNTFLRQQQFGFRREHSTAFQHTLVSTQLFEAVKKRQSSTGLLLNVCKNFDRVWHKGFINKHALSPFPPSVVFSHAIIVVQSHYSASICRTHHQTYCWWRPTNTCPQPHPIFCRPSLASHPLYTDDDMYCSSANF